MKKEKLKILSPNEALEQFEPVQAGQYLAKMLEQLGNADLCKYLARYYYNGNTQLAWREVTRMRHQAPFARVNR